MEQKSNELHETNAKIGPLKSGFLIYSVILPVSPSLFAFMWKLVSGINIHFDELGRLLFCDSLLLAFSFGVSLAAEIFSDSYLYQTHKTSFTVTWLFMLLFIVSWARFYENTSHENITDVFVFVLWFLGLTASVIFPIIWWRYKEESYKQYSSQYSEIINKQKDVIINLQKQLRANKENVSKRSLRTEVDVVE